MKLISRLKNKRVASSADSNDSSDDTYRPVRFSLLATFREVAEQDRQARTELAELQKILGTKSKKETMAAMNEFVDMMESGEEEGERTLGHF